MNVLGYKWTSNTKTTKAHQQIDKKEIFINIGIFLSDPCEISRFGFLGGMNIK